MTSTELLAYIGAAAWLPQIGKWFHALVVKPKVRIAPAPTVSLGYTNFGPVVQLNVGLSTERCDALIERIAIDVTHERGDRRLLPWFALSEPGQQIIVPSGEVASLDRNQPATAIKVVTTALADRQVRFNDPEFADKLRLCVDRVVDHYRFLKTRDTNPLESALGSKELRDVQEFVSRDFFWKSGNYTFSIQVHSSALSKPHVQRFAVNVSVQEADSLQSNCQLFGSYVQGVILSNEGGPAGRILWKWARPAIRALD